MSADEDVRFVDRAVDHPGALTCGHCGGDVPLPKTEPWIMVEGTARPPALVSVRCPHCDRRIYLNPAEARDEEEPDV